VYAAGSLWALGPTLRRFDVSTPGDPRRDPAVSVEPQCGRPDTGVADGTRLWLHHDIGGCIELFDLSGPVPVSVDRFSMEDWPEDAGLVHARMAAVTGGLVVVDPDRGVITAIRQNLTGELEIAGRLAQEAGATCAGAAGPHLVVRPLMEEAAGLYDISDPADPWLTGRFAVHEDLTRAVRCDVQIDGDTATTAGPGAWALLNLSGPASITVTSSARLPDLTGGFDTAGGTLFLAAGLRGLLAVTDPDGAADVAVLRLGGSTIDVAAEGGLAVAARGNDGITTVDVTDLGAPAQLGSLELGGLAHHVEIDGNRAYVLVDRSAVSHRWWLGGARLAIVDISEPRLPQLVGDLDIAGEPSGLLVDGTRVYVAGHAGLEVIDISDPVRPRMLDVGAAILTSGDMSTSGLFDAPEQPVELTSVSKSGDFIYAAAGPDGLLVYRVLR
jgi:hypothetical protein